METQAVLGETVIYTDPSGVDCTALVTAVWSDTCINVIFVSKDQSKRDSYGRQIERATSVGHPSIYGDQAVHGNYYRLIGQDKIGYKPPQQV
jgi:hypothetical protein